MRLLILGGTQFLGRAIAAHACAEGHAVTCASRGLAGPVAPGARFVAIDRDAPDGLEPLKREEFDAVVDVSRQPGQVRRAVTATQAAGGALDLRLDGECLCRQSRSRAASGHRRAFGTHRTRDRAQHRRDLRRRQGRMRAGRRRRRLHLSGGPHRRPGRSDGRFSYWPARLARGGEVLAPGYPEDPVQFIDVRDLAQWIVHAAQCRLTGIYDGTGPTCTRGEMLTECAIALGSCSFIWADRRFLEEQDVRIWSGPRSLPLWLPLPD